MTNLLLGVLAGLIVTVISFVAGFFYSKFRSHWGLRHLEQLIPRDRRVQIVLPSTQVKNFLVKGESKGESIEAYFPSNVLIMPMPEAEAIATLVDSFRNLSRGVRVHLTTDEQVSNSYGLTISVGGPSVNRCSRSLLKADYPLFNLRYPEHVAAWGTTTWEPQRGESDDLLEDYGYLFCSRRGGQKHRIVLCGVWGTGTLAAVRGFIELPPSSDVARSLTTSSRTFLAFRTQISGHEFGDVRLIMHTNPE